jgi:hypothetical protein
VDASTSKICPVESHRAYALKNIQVFPLACKLSSLTKDGAYWPYYNDQRHFPNDEKAGPTYVVPPLHEATWMAADPQSLPWALCE